MYTGVMHLCNPAIYTHRCCRRRRRYTGFSSGIIEIIIYRIAVVFTVRIIGIVLGMPLKNANTLYVWSYYLGYGGLLFKMCFSVRALKPIPLSL